MNEPGKYVLLKKVQSSSKNIQKVKKQKNKQLKKKLEPIQLKKAAQVPKRNGSVPQSGEGVNKKKKKNKQKALKQNNKDNQNKASTSQKKKNPDKKSHTPDEGKKQKPTSVQSKQPKKNFQDDLSDRLKASRFRFINEQLYTQTGDQAIEVFNQDESAFTTYHEGYRKQIEQWPINPLDRIINSIKKLPLNFVVADFGCGEARLAESISQKCYSFDLVATNNRVIACNMAHTPLSSDAVDVAVFCLSLMGTNLKDFLLEANRVLKVGGHLKVAEIESRFENINDFVYHVKLCGFDLISKDISTKVFYFLYFKKTRNVTNTKQLTNFSLKPCMYKKR